MRKDFQAFGMDPGENFGQAVDLMMAQFVGMHPDEGGNALQGLPVKVLTGCSLPMEHDRFKDYPLLGALDSMIHNPDAGYAPRYGIHGSISNIPFTTWLESDKGQTEREVRRLKRHHSLNIQSAMNLLNRGIPSLLEEVLLDRSKRDETCPAYFCRVPQVPEEYPLRNFDLWGANLGDELMRKSVIGKIVYCVHCYLGAFLARDADAVKALYYPGDLRLGMATTQRLALGVIREVCIFKYFNSLGDFWQIFEQMYELGRQFVCLYDYSEVLDRPRVEFLLRNDPAFLTMFNLMAEMTVEPLELGIHFEVCDDYRAIPLQGTIGLPTSARDLLLLQD